MGQDAGTSGRSIGCRASTRQNVYAIADHGAHVTRWRSARFGELLFLSSRARAAPGVAIRGGIPICFPWFASGVSGDMSPAHGLVRTARWPRTAWEVDDQRSVLTARYQTDERQITDRAGAARFPHRFTARYDVTLAPEHGRFTLRITNDGPRPFVFGAALHTYFAISDVEAVTVSGLHAAAYVDKVTDRSAVQSGDVHLGGEIDRVYDSTTDVTVADAGLERTIRISKRGSPQTVVWNPGPEKAAAMADLGDGQWRQLVCVEAVVLQSEPLYPGRHRELEQQVFVSSR